MCGICGFVGFRDDELLYKMTELLKHRGPDAEGYFICEDVSLGIKRLAIIDLKTGNQPIYNEDKSIVIVFNGEIYNYIELRKQLELKGHKFYTNTDTETIIHLYEEYQEDCLKYLCGMFAFALWDKKEEKLFIARDRLGIKPLFYSQFDGCLIFASEIKSILQCRKISKEINLFGLDQYLTFLYIPSPSTIFRNIFHLPAGSYMVYRNKKLEIKKYWNLEFNETSYSEKYYIQKLDSLFENVIAQHLISDVPIGIFLSGGLDSSTITVYSSKVLQKSINSFSIGYSQMYKDFNELEKAELVSKITNVNFIKYIVQPELIGQLLDTLVYYLEQPFADSS
ncbi:MAG: asparagine synthase (glutamine-hydrolyzing), partial [Endomicrobiia bacterium]